MVSILMPVYNAAPYIIATLRSILTQSFKDYEVVIVDDCSTDGTPSIIRAFYDKRIRFYQNEHNLGYSLNMRECNKKANGDIIFLMADDDILGRDALKNTVRWFEHEDIGAVTRPYFWFDKSIDKPVRAKMQLNPFRDKVVNIHSCEQRVLRVFQTLDQFSGLAMRKEFIESDFHEDIFPCHIYPFVSIFRNHPIVFLKDYTVAVRIKSSQTRKLSHIYDKSPMQSWVNMIEHLLTGSKYDAIRNYLIKDFIAINYVGLAQIRNYGRFKFTLREIALLIKYRPRNLLGIAFWMFALGAILIPPFFLRRLVDWYKDNINSQLLPEIKFRYDA